MADCNPERIMFMKHMWLKLNYIPVLNALLITDSLGLHKICILKRTSSKEEQLAFWVKENNFFIWNSNGMTIRD